MAPSLSPTPRNTRRLLIEAAQELFHTAGYHQTSLAAVRERAGVNAGSLYYFFKTKEGLLLAVLERYEELLTPTILAPAYERTNDPIERIFSILDRYRQLLLESDFATGCPIGNLALEITGARPEVSGRIARNFDRWCQAIQLCLEAAAERLPPDLDPGRLSRFVLTVMEGAVLQARGHRSIESFDESVAQLRDYFERLESQAQATTSHE